MTINSHVVMCVVRDRKHASTTATERFDGFASRRERFAIANLLRCKKNLIVLPANDAFLPRFMGTVFIFLLFSYALARVNVCPSKHYRKQRFIIRRTLRTYNKLNSVRKTMIFISTRRTPSSPQGRKIRRRFGPFIIYCFCFAVGALRS